MGRGSRFSPAWEARGACQFNAGYTWLRRLSGGFRHRHLQSKDTRVPNRADARGADCLYSRLSSETHEPAILAQKLVVPQVLACKMGRLIALTCYGLNVCVPHKFLTPSVMVFGGGVFWR